MAPHITKGDEHPHLVVRDSVASVSTESSTGDELKEKPGIVFTSVEAARSSDTDIDKNDVPRVPDKRYPRLFRGLRLRIFIIYRRLFSFVWLANLVTLICILAIPSIGRQWITTVSYINLTIAVLIRQDFIINALYTICCAAAKSWPLAIRIRLAKIYHFGGVHSGAASAAVCWFIGSLGYNIKCAVGTCSLASKPSVASIVLGFIVLALLLSMIIFAYPPFRKKSHNTFEQIHRFSGWTAVAIIWAQTVVSVRDQQLAATPAETLGSAVLRSPLIWMMVAITISIAFSWFWLREVPVDAEVLSDHAIRLHLNYAVPVNGSFARFSERPLLEWHSFATIAAPEAVNGHPRGFSIVVSRAGDWTSRQIERPPTKLWTRGVPTCGVMRITPLFNRLVLIGTGSGIGPLLGHIQMAPCPVRLVWSTPSPVETFGRGIVDAVYKGDPDAIIHDTRALGRPDMVALAWKAYKDFNAEAVCIIANEKITKKVVYGMESRGIPAFGAIWDS